MIRTALLHDIQAGKSPRFINKETKVQREKRACLRELS